MTKIVVDAVVLADRGLSEDKIRIMDYGADEFAVKPMSMESLIKSEQEVTRKKLDSKNK